MAAVLSAGRGALCEKKLEDGEGKGGDVNSRPELYLIMDLRQPSYMRPLGNPCSAPPLSWLVRPPNSRPHVPLLLSLIRTSRTPSSLKHQSSTSAFTFITRQYIFSCDPTKPIKAADSRWYRIWALLYGFGELKVLLFFTRC